MIDHHEQHCRQILIDELEAARPSLAAWASAEFDAGTSAAELCRTLFVASPYSMGLLSDATDVADSIQRDETGDIIGTTFTGNGNGGNLSLPSLKAKGRLQIRLNDIKQMLHPSSKKG